MQPAIRRHRSRGLIRHAQTILVLVDEVQRSACLDTRFESNNVDQREVKPILLNSTRSGEGQACRGRRGSVGPVEE
jgi:hypothetical protein